MSSKTLALQYMPCPMSRRRTGRFYLQSCPQSNGHLLIGFSHRKVLSRLHDTLHSILINSYSAAAHRRKPNIGFYKHVIKETGIDPSRTIFIDDRPENVLAARSFGMHGIVFDDQAEVIRKLKNLCGDPVSRGNNFLASHKKHFPSIAENNIEFSDVISLSLSLSDFHHPTVTFS